MFEEQDFINDSDKIFCHIYTRVSTGKQVKEGLSLENQKMKCRNFALERGWNIINFYTDEGKSGKNMQRKGLQQMISSCRPNDRIIVYAMSRLGRNVSEMAQTYESLKKKGVTLCSVSEKHVDDNTAMGKFFIHLMFNMAEWELNETTARSKVILDNKKMCGEQISQVGFGYKIKKWTNRKYVYPIVHEQAGIMFIVESRTQEPPVSWRNIGEAMHTRGWYPVKTNRFSDEIEEETKRKWSRSTLQGLFEANKERFLNTGFLSLKQMTKYEDYKVPLCVPYREIENYINYETGEFDYLKKFGYMYGISGIHFPNMKQIQKDIKDGRFNNFPEKFKEDVNNACTYGVDNKGNPKFDIRDKNLKFFLEGDLPKLEKFFVIMRKRNLDEKSLNETAKKFFDIPQEIIDRERDAIYNFLILCEGMENKEMMKSFREDF